MNRRSLLMLAGGPVLQSLPAWAQQGAIRRIGYFSAGSATVNAPRLAAFRQGMKELGWIEGKDFLIDARYANGVAENVAQLVTDTVASRPDLVLTSGAVAVLSGVPKTIPIVFATAADPIALGIAKTLQRPGGNATGLSSLRGPLAAKRLEMLKQAFPHIGHVAMLLAAQDAASKSQLKDIEDAAARLGIRISPIEIDKGDMDLAIKRAPALGCHGFLVVDGYLVNARRHQIAEAINRSKLPAMFARTEQVEAGGLMSYSSSTFDSFRRAAVYVDKILKGANPGDLPIEQPAKFDLVVNLRTAKTIGVTIPKAFLQRANRVIE